MKAVAKARFLHGRIYYKAGDPVDLQESLLKTLASKGLVQAVEVQKPEPKKEPEPQKAETKKAD